MTDLILIKPITSISIKLMSESLFVMAKHGRLEKRKSESLYSYVYIWQTLESLNEKGLAQQWYENGHRNIKKFVVYFLH